MLLVLAVLLALGSWVHGVAEEGQDVTTVYGLGTVDGETVSGICVFGFEYEGAQYFECTTAGTTDDNGPRWCGFDGYTGVGDTNWGECQARTDSKCQYFLLITN